MDLAEEEAAQNGYTPSSQYENLRAEYMASGITHKAN